MAEMAEKADFVPPHWAKPAPLGYAASADAAHFVAAPLLASGAIAFLGVVAADGDKFRLPGLTLLGLGLAVVCLLASIQAGFRARALLYSAGDVEQWWGREDAERLAERLRAEQRRHYETWRRRISRSVTLYNVGVALLGAGVTVALLPPGSGPGAVGSNLTDPACRWVAVAVLGAATGAELVWALWAPRWWLRLRVRRPRARQPVPPSAPAAPDLKEVEA